MSHRKAAWTFSALAFVALAAVIGAVVDHYTHRVLRRVDNSFGYRPDPVGVRTFLQELDKPTFQEAGADAVRQAKGLDVFLYRATDKAHKRTYGEPWQCWNQGNAGTCVSFAFGLGCQTALATDWLAGKGSPPTAVATEPIYGGARTFGMGQPTQFGGDGATGFGAARWISGKCKMPDVGGVLFRKKYGAVDLTTYSIPLSREWGSRGVPLELAKLAHQNKCYAVAQVQTWEELASALESGYPVAVCSQVGYGPTPRQRDALGFLTRGTSWSHAMLVWGIRHQKNGGGRDGALIQNSWQTSWVDGPRWPSDQPDGSFWTSRENIETAMRQGDSWAISGTTFEYKKLDNADWGLAQ